MTRNDLNVLLCAILATLAEFPEGAPSGVMFAAVSQSARGSLEDYQTAIAVVKGGGLATERDRVLTITPKGREVVSKITAHNAARQVST